MKVLAHNLLLLVLTLALGALWLALRPSVPGSEGGVPESALPGFRAERVQRVRVRRGEPAEGQATVELASASVELARSSNGWFVVERFGWPAESYPIVRLLSALERLSALDVVGEERAGHASFGVDDGGTVVELLTLEGDVLAEVIQGRAAQARPDEAGAPGAVPNAAGRAAGTYLRVAGKTEVYRAAGVPPLASRPRAWLATQLFALDPAQVASIQLQSGDGRSTDVTHAGSGWTNERGAKVTRFAVDELLSELGSLYLIDAAAPASEPAMGLGTAARWRVSLGLAAGEPLQLAIGAPDGEGRVFVQRRPDQPVVLLSVEAVVRLEAALERFF